MDRAQTAASQWAKEIPELDVQSMLIIGRLSELAHILMKDHMAPNFAAHGLKPGEFDVLATLRRSGEPYALMPTELYNSTMISSGGMTARLDRLQKAGLIFRKPHVSDRRAMMVVLSNEGKALIEEILPKHVATQKKALEHLTQDEQQVLKNILGKMTEALS